VFNIRAKMALSDVSDGTTSQDLGNMSVRRGKRGHIGKGVLVRPIAISGG